MSRTIWHTVTTADGEYTVTVPSDILEPLPLADALAAALPQLFQTSTSAKRACRRKGGAYSVLLADGSDGRCEHKVRGGEMFRVVGRQPSGSSMVQLAVVLEEAAVAVVHKPAGMVVHGDGPNTLHSALGRVLQGAVPVHRLDAPTEGLVICARTKAAMVDLSRQFETHEVRKRYRAVVHGSPVADAGTVDAPIDDQSAVTEWRVRWRGHSTRHGPIASLDLWPQTGRKHQLRRHLAERLGMPIVGDVRYAAQADDGAASTLRYAPLLLMAIEVDFDRPPTGPDGGDDGCVGGRCVGSERLRCSLEEPKRFRNFELLPPVPATLVMLEGGDCSGGGREGAYDDAARDDAEATRRLLAAVVRAGQRQDRRWHALWTKWCAAEGVMVTACAQRASAEVAVAHEDIEEDTDAAADPDTDTDADVAADAAAEAETRAAAAGAAGAAAAAAVFEYERDPSRKSVGFLRTFLADVLRDDALDGTARVPWVPDAVRVAVLESVAAPRREVEVG